MRSLPQTQPPQRPPPHRHHRRPPHLHIVHTQAQEQARGDAGARVPACGRHAEQVVAKAAPLPDRQLGSACWPSPSRRPFSLARQALLLERKAAACSGPRTRQAPLHAGAAKRTAGFAVLGQQLLQLEHVGAGAREQLLQLLVCDTSSAWMRHAWASVQGRWQTGPCEPACSSITVGFRRNLAVPPTKDDDTLVLGILQPILLDVRPQPLDHLRGARQEGSTSKSAARAGRRVGCGQAGG